MSALNIESLGKRYGQTWAVRNLSLNVGAGQIFGLLGPNGSGKTTTLACALGLLPASEGRSSVLGVPAAHIHRTAGRVGVVFDSATLVPRLTARGNLEYARRTLGHRGGRTGAEALALVGMSELAGRRAGKLSLGQQKRVAIARALLGKPELLVLDEPLSGLDPMGVRSMLTLFRELRADGLTLVLSSHRLHEMQAVVTHVGILLGGCIVRAGSLREVLGSDRDQLHLTCSASDGVEAALAGLAGLEIEKVDEPHAADAGLVSWVLSGTQLEAAAIVRKLVDSECDVHALARMEPSLQAIFEALVDEAVQA